MRLNELLVVVNDDLRQMMFPKCNAFEKIGVGIALAGLTYKIGEIVSGNADLISDFKLVDADGNVDIGLLEYAVGNGIEWPLSVGSFKFDKADFDKIIKHIKELK